MLFRKGSAHSNHGSDYTDRVKTIVKLIRNRYNEQVPIILCADSGFADQKAYENFEDQLGIHYITTSKIYQDVKKYVKDIPSQNFGEFKKTRLYGDMLNLATSLSFVRNSNDAYLLNATETNRGSM